jgi:hypothetical protein
MTTLLWIIAGVLVAIGIGAYFFSDRANPKEKAKEAAGMAAGSALMGVGCIIQLILSALPIALAILIVLWTMKGCS